MSVKMIDLPCIVQTTTVADLEKLRKSLKVQQQKTPNKYDCTSRKLAPALLTELPKVFEEDQSNQYVSFDRLRIETGIYFNGFWFIPANPGAETRLKEIVVVQSWVDKGHDPTGDSLALVSERPHPPGDTTDTPAIATELKSDFIKRAIAWVLAIAFTEEFEEFVRFPVHKQLKWIRKHITGTHENRLFDYHILIWMMGRFGRSINLHFLFGHVDLEKLADAHKKDIREACRDNVIFTVAHICLLAWNMVVDHDVDGKMCSQFSHCRKEFNQMWKKLNDVEYLKEMRVPLVVWPVCEL